MARILIVDDSQFFLSVAKKSLVKEHPRLELATATTALEALLELKKNEFDVVVSDYQMPQMDGLQLLQRLRQEGNFVPFIMLTGKGQEEVAIQALNLGADYYLKKEGDIKILLVELVHIIQKVVRYKEMKEELYRRKQYERTLKEREQRYRALFERTYDGVFIISLNQVHLAANQRAAKMLGYEVDELIGMRTDKIIVPKEYSESQQAFEALITGKTTPIYERTFRRKDGTEIIVELNNALVYDSLGKPLHIQSIVRDITERKQTEEKLKRLNRILMEERNIFIRGDVVVFKRQNKEGWPVEYVSANVKDVFGYTVEEFTSGKISYAEIISKEDIDRVASEVQKFSMNDIISFDHGDYRIIRKNGEQIWLKDFTTILRNEEGDITHYLGYVMDVTERRKVSDTLREREEQYHMLFQNAPIGILTCDIHGQILSVNKQALNLLGFPSEEAIVQTNMLTDSFLGKRGISSDLQHCLKTGREKIAERSYTSKLGKELILHLKMVPVRNNRGEITQILAVFEDIKKLKQTEEALRESEENYRELVEKLHDGVLIVDTQGIITFINPRTAELLGYPGDQLIGQHWTTISSQMNHDKAAKELSKQRIEDRRSSYETVLSPKNKSPVSVIINTTPLYTSAGIQRGSLLVLTDITKQKQAEKILQQARDHLVTTVEERTLELENTNKQLLDEINNRKQIEDALRKSKEMYRELVEKLREGVIMEDTNGLITFINPRGAELTGYSPKELIGMHWTILVPEEEIKKIQRETAKRPQGISSNYEVQLLKKDGEKVSILISATPLFTVDKKYRGSLSVFTDLTDLKRAQQELMRADRLASLGRITAGVAHELNNPLHFIQGNVEILEFYLDKFKDIYRLQCLFEEAIENRNFLEAQEILLKLKEAKKRYQIDEILQDITDLQYESQEGIDRMTKIVADLRIFSFIGGAQTQKEPCNISELLESTINMLRYQFKDRISVELLLEDLPLVWGYPNRLSQAFLNILTNAGDAIEGSGGCIQIIARPLLREVCINIRDNGMGIPEEHQSKLFNLFFTTKSLGKGTGLGLAITHEIIHMHDGKISIQSQVGEGTDVEIRLPAINGVDNPSITK